MFLKVSVAMYFIAILMREEGIESQSAHMAFYSLVFSIFNCKQIKVKALEQENESLRQRIIQKRMELMYLLQQRPCPSLPRILPSSYKSSEHGDSFRLIGETLNTLFID